MSLFQFNEAAKLYAVNIDVINAMRGKFNDECSRFIGALRSAINENMEGQPLQVNEPESGWVYFYTSASKVKGPPTQPCLTINPYKYLTEVTQGSLRIWPYAEGASPEQRRRLKASLASHFSAPGLDNFTWAVGVNWKDTEPSLASLATSSPDGFDMALLGQVCARLLRFVNDEHQALLKSSEEALPPGEEGA